MDNFSYSEWKERVENRGREIHFHPPADNRLPFARQSKQKKKPRNERDLILSEVELEL